MSLQRLLADFCRSRYFANQEKPIQIGVYRPSVLSWSCLRKQYNYYSQLHNKKPEEIPDEVVLLLAGGVVFHRLVQSLKDDGKSYWDKVEVECFVEVPTTTAKTIKIIGHADAIKGRGVYATIYEFKHTRQAPNKPHFDHLLQLNFYLGALNINRGVLAYISYNQSGGLVIKEFSHLFSDWHFQHLINRAEVLHTMLINQQTPRCSCRDRIHEMGQIL